MKKALYISLTDHHNTYVDYTLVTLNSLFQTTDGDGYDIFVFHTEEVDIKRITDVFPQVTGVLLDSYGNTIFDSQSRKKLQFRDAYYLKVSAVKWLMDNNYNIGVSLDVDLVVKNKNAVEEMFDMDMTDLIIRGVPACACAITSYYTNEKPVGNTCEGIMLDPDDFKHSYNKINTGCYVINFDNLREYTDWRVDDFTEIMDVCADIFVIATDEDYFSYKIPYNMVGFLPKEYNMFVMDFVDYKNIAPKIYTNTKQYIYSGKIIHYIGYYKPLGEVNDDDDYIVNVYDYKPYINAMKPVKHHLTYNFRKTMDTLEQRVIDNEKNYTAIQYDTTALVNKNNNNKRQNLINNIISGEIK